MDPTASSDAPRPARKPRRAACFGVHLFIRCPSKNPHPIADEPARDQIEALAVPAAHDTAGQPQPARPRAPCRGHVPGRRQPPARCARAAELAKITRRPADRLLHACDLDRGRSQPGTVCLALVALLLLGVGFLLSEQIGPVMGIGRPMTAEGPGGIGISASVYRPSTRRLPTCGPSHAGGMYSGAGPPSKGCQVSSRAASRLISR
jgi:hypothetical protein